FVRFCLNRLGQALLVALRAFRPTRTVRQTQIGTSIHDCRGCMPEINADDGWLLVFGACNRSTARIPLVNRTAPGCGEKQKKRNNDNKKHEPDEENHGPPPSCPK